MPVVAGKVEQKDVPIYLDGLGTVQAFNTVTVHTRVDGALVQVNFSEGQDVKTGDLLAVVDPKPYQAALDQAKAQAALDQVTLKRQADLRARNVIAQQDYDTAVANAQKSKAATDAAQVNFDYSTSNRRSTAAPACDLSILAMSFTLRTKTALSSSRRCIQSRSCSRCRNKIYRKS